MRPVVGVLGGWLDVPGGCCIGLPPGVLLAGHRCLCRPLTRHLVGKRGNNCVVFSSLYSLEQKKKWMFHLSAINSFSKMCVKNKRFLDYKVKDMYM